MSHYSSYSREDWTTCGVIPQAQCHRTTKPPSNTHLTLAVKEFLVIELNDYIEMMENLVKSSTLEQCLNTDLSDKAGTLGWEKSGATVKHSAHLN